MANNILKYFLTFILLCCAGFCDNAPAYDGKYHGPWYPIGQSSLPFAKAEGRLFSFGGKTQYLTGTNAWWLPRLRINADVDTVMNDIAQSGLKTIRIWGYATFNYTPPVDYGGFYQSWFQLLNSSGTYINYGANGLERLDYVVHMAEKLNLGLVIPMVDYNGGNGDLTDDLGGIDLYENVFGCNATQWYTSSVCQSAYRSYAETIINRYKASPAIFAWEIMNEPRCEGCDLSVVQSWATDFSAWVKSLDPNHMVTLGSEGWFGPNDGFGNKTYEYDGEEGVDFVKNLQIPSIDYGTVHCYPIAYGHNLAWGSTWIKQHDLAGARIGKPVVIEEYGTPFGPNNHTGISGWQTTIVQDTEIAMDSFWDFGIMGLSKYDSAPKLGVPYMDSATIFYGKNKWYQQLVVAHTKAMAAKGVM